MNGAFEIAEVGLEGQQRALEIVANNIANMNTPAFKRTEVRFSTLMSLAPDPANPPAALGHTPALAGVSTNGVLALDEQGEIERTQDASALAIQGPGFIELMGANGETLLWRGGELDVGADGTLNAAGHPLKAMIAVPDDASAISIAADGTVTAQSAGGVSSTALGRIALVQVTDPGGVEQMDGGLFRVVDDNAVDRSETPSSQIVQGGIEHSNVNLNDEMIQLMMLQRAFSANAQVVQAADQIMALANDLRK